MISDMNNVRKLMEILGDEGFVTALTNAEELVDEVGETLDRVEQIESDAEDAVREANAALNAVDHRLQKFDETIRLLEAKIEAAFSIAFLFFALNNYLAGELLLAAGLFIMGLLGASSLVITILTMPQVRRLRKMGRYARSRRKDSSPDESTISDDSNGSQAESRKGKSAQSKRSDTETPSESDSTGSTDSSRESGRSSNADDSARDRPRQKRWRTRNETSDE